MQITLYGYLMEIKMWRRLLLIVLGGLLALEGMAQEGYSYQLRYLTTEEGLSQNTVDDIMCDSQGFLWIATWNGLCRYDGYQFSVIKAEDDPRGLPDNFIQQLCEDSQNRLWIGTARGLAVYNLLTETFESLDWVDEQLVQANITSIAVAPDQMVWIGTENLGLFVLNPSEKSVATYRNDLEKELVGAVLVSREGFCYVGVGNRLVRTEYREGEIRQISERVLPIPAWANISSFCEDPNGTLWIGTTLGLYRIESPHQELTSFYHNTDNPRSLVHNTVQAITRDANGDLLIGTLGGLCIYQGKGQFAALSGHTGGPTRLNNPFVNSLLSDTLGNVWIGTEKGGLNTYNIYQKQFKYLTHQAGNSNSLSHETVNSILVEEEFLWVGTAGGGLNRVRISDGAMSWSRSNPGQPQSLSNDFVTAVHRSQQGDIWLATWGDGINRMVGDDMQTFERYYPGGGEIGSNFISSMWQDPRGFWLVGTSTGLIWFDEQAGTFGKIPLDPKHPEAVIAVGCLMLDREGYYWIGTPQGGYRFAAEDLIPEKETPSSVEFFSLKTHREMGLAGDYIISLHQDAKGRIWLGTFGSGLLQAEIEGGKIARFSTFRQSDGLCNNTCYAIEEGSSGELWLSTDYGLARFDPDSRHVTNYYRSDGLLDNQFYWGASDKGPDGKLYFGGVSGMSFFDPTEIRPYPFSPEVAITDFKVMNRSLEPGEKRYGQVAMLSAAAVSDTVLLSYQDNVFSIDFSALAYYLPERLTYQYRMEGVDPDWVEVPADRHFASYTNLSGGSYRFEVRGINEDGVVSENTASLWVVVRPPFWETPWFQGLMLLLLIIAVMVYINLRTRYLHQQKAKLEQEVTRRTHQIEEQNARLEKQKGDLIELNEQVKMVNQLRLRFFTNISHEFRTPLTLIVDPIQNLLEQFPEDTTTGRTLRIVHRNSRRLLHLINQLMHFRRLESGKLKLQVGKGDLLAFVQEVFISFNHLAEQREVQYRLDVQGTPQADTWFDPEKLENILFNLLGNAFKYTPEGGHVDLRVRFGKNQQVRFEVEDTGPGIPKEQQKRIFDHFYQVENTENRNLHGSGIGLALSKELVQVLRGRIWVESEPGKGSLFGVEVPYGKEAFSASERTQSPQPYQSNLSTQVTLAQEEFSIQATPEDSLDDDKSQKPLVLIAEDNYDLMAFLTQSLRGNYRVLSAQNGKDALELARKYTPQLIVSDVMMPVMDGLELCSQLKGNIQTSHIPVILLTARDTVEHWVEGLESGADDYVPKPFNLKILQTRIDNLINSRQQLKLIYSKGQMPNTREVASNSVDQEFLQKVHDLLEKRGLEPDFSHDELADEMCISRSLLYKKLKALTGMTVTEFINSHRLRKASELLVLEQLTISEVAFQCGFNDPKYFSRVFRKYYGMSPSEYVQTNLESTQ